ncbi:hypothetical protein CCHR01_04407 [Colletotrichum chrysophilum]|uniref:Uncharacterized protein n=1 Tax=Colletotrichum chrysophilum TaxID=1836956 RepID=A0AAD9EMK4_9PEZI|nr:hypothetical protein CCHR01_04407 [Colletotrichum chrysophilum]
MMATENFTTKPSALDVDCRCGDACRSRPEA